MKPLTNTIGTLPTACVGECDGSGEVTVDELIKGVNNALSGCAEAPPTVTVKPPTRSP